MAIISQEKNLADWLHYIEALHPNNIELGLERVKKIAERADLLQFNCPVIIVGGTNGKGSCIAILQAIMQAAGLKVATYTSPHILHFNERIQIGGQPVDDETLCTAFRMIQSQLHGTQLTFFEFTTLAALWCFQQVQLDVLLLEVGLGGRLDAVNIVEPNISVITTIDIDHIEWLGNDREAIGHEKAGIFRRNKFAVCGDADPPQSVKNRAEALALKLHSLTQQFHFQLHR